MAAVTQAAATAFYRDPHSKPVVKLWRRGLKKRKLLWVSESDESIKSLNRETIMLVSNLTLKYLKCLILI